MRTWLIVCVGLLMCLGAGCERHEQPSTPRARPTVASLSPAATDLLLEMGAGDHLVAVSHWDASRQATASLPRVGDYQSTDWERLAVLRPDVLIIQLGTEKFPPGFQARAEQLGIRLVNIHIDRLEEIFAALHTLGETAGEPAKAQRLEQRIRGQLEQVRQRVADRPSVPTLIVVDEQAQSIVGSNNFLDDLLTLAGGTNLAGQMRQDYPMIDRETLVRLDPPAVIQLLPEAPPQILQQAQRVWSSLPEVSAVKNKQVHVLSEWYVLLPGGHVGELAESMARSLHGGRSEGDQP